MIGRNQDLEAENNELRMRLQQSEASVAALAQKAKAKASPVKKERNKPEKMESPKATSQAASADGTVMTIPSSDEDEMVDGEDKKE